MNESADETLNVPMEPTASSPAESNAAPAVDAAADQPGLSVDKPVRSRRPAVKRDAVSDNVDQHADGPASVDEAQRSDVESPSTLPAPARRRRQPARSPIDAPEALRVAETTAASGEQRGDALDAVAVGPETPSAVDADLPALTPSTAAAEAAAGDAPQPTGSEQPLSAPVPSEPPLQVGELFAQVLSGVFDETAEAPSETAEASVPPKRVLAPEPEAPKLHKVLAQAGVGSRRDMEQMIADGLVTVNGQPAHTGQRISFGDRIAVDGKPVKVRIQPLPARLIAYHKPAGEVVTHDDPQQRPTVFRRLPRLPQGKWQSVGRLDLNTEGLLLFTNNGQLANQLMHPRFGVEREYAVRLLGRVDPQTSAKLIEGIEIEGQKCAFRSIEDGGGDGANHWYRVVITEGRNREVRRLFDAVGLTVSRLIRIRYGSVVLPRGLKRGVWVDLNDADLRAVRQLVSAGQRPHGDDGRGERPAENERPPRPAHEPRPRRDGRDGREPRPPGQPPLQGNGPRQAPRHAQVSFDHVDRPRSFDPEVDPDFEEEIDHARIPNPLEQTFDKRFVQNPRGPAGGRGFGQGGGGFGAGGSAPRNGGGGAGNARKNPGAPREPDPMQTSVGYIGGDAFLRRNNRGNGGGGGGGGGGGQGGNRGGGPRGGNGGPRGSGGGGGGYRGR